MRRYFNLSIYIFMLWNIQMNFFRSTGQLRANRCVYLVLFLIFFDNLHTLWNWGAGVGQLASNALQLLSIYLFIFLCLSILQLLDLFKQKIHCVPIKYAKTNLVLWCIFGIFFFFIFFCIYFYCYLPNLFIFYWIKRLEKKEKRIFIKSISFHYLFTGSGVVSSLSIFF